MTGLSPASICKLVWAHMHENPKCLDRKDRVIKYEILRNIDFGGNKHA
jgi:hypothetical protein